MDKQIKIQQKSIVIIYPLLDHRFINSKQFRDIPKLEGDSYGISVMESLKPPLKRLILPQSRTQIIIDSQKVSVFDDTAKEPNESDLIKKYTLNVLELLKDFQSSTYGFNYNVLFESPDSDERDLLGKRLLSSIPGNTELSAFGTRLVYLQKEVKYDVRIERIKGKQLSAYLNCHYESKLPSSIDTIHSQFVSNYKYLTKFLEKL